LSEDDDKNVSRNPVQGEEVGSARSASTIDEQREYKILKAMEQARAKFNGDKVELRESGTLIDPRDVWGNLMTALPEEALDMKQVIEIIEEQIKKGRVITRAGDPPGRYHFIWKDPNGDGGGEPKEQEGER